MAGFNAPRDSDSIIAGLGTAAVYSIEQQFSDLTNYSFLNKGVGGETSSQIAARITTDLIDWHPRVAVIEGGINDVALGGADPKTVFLNSWTSMLNAAQADSDIALIMVLKIMPCSNGTNSEMQARDDWNASLATLAAGYSKAVVVDTSSYVGQFRAGGDPGNVWDIQGPYTVDGTHFTQEGNAQLAQALADTFASTTTLASSVNPTTYAQSTRLTATVTPSTATGTVTFKDGSTTIGTATLGHGSGSVTVSSLSVGSHSLTAVYGGDSNFSGSTSNTVTQTVNDQSSSSSSSSSTSSNVTSSRGPDLSIGGGGGGGSSHNGIASRTSSAAGGSSSSSLTPLQLRSLQRKKLREDRLKLPTDLPSASPGPTHTASSLRDIPSAAWYAEVSQEAVNRGWMAAPDGFFSPDRPVTVGEMAKALLAVSGKTLAPGDDVVSTTRHALGLSFFLLPHPADEAVSEGDLLLSLEEIFRPRFQELIRNKTPGEYTHAFNLVSSTARCASALRLAILAGWINPPPQYIGPRQSPPLNRAAMAKILATAMTTIEASH